MRNDVSKAMEISRYFASFKIEGFAEIGIDWGIVSLFFQRIWGNKINEDEFVEFLQN